MSDILDQIDAATAELCACGCGRPLPPDGPSGWWASEACQARWQWGGETRSGRLGVALPDGQILEFDPEWIRVTIHRAHQVIGDALREFATAIQRCAPAIRQLAEIAAKHQADPEPTDPMERALYLRRNRNTGPKVQHRAPRRIDARRPR